MCGIAGLFGPNANPQAVESMRSCLHHRGPDDQGLFAEGQLAVAHTRLCVIDPSDAGQQPMRTPEGRHVLVYNGEVYNYREMRQELGRAGASFRSGTDTEVVLHALVRWGESALDRFKGMFALAFFDTQTERLLLARDRLGVKPLYYFRDRKGVLVFASEIRSLLESGCVPRRLDRRVLPDFLSQQTAPTPGTLVEGVRSLPPGHLGRFDGDTFETERYAGIPRSVGSASDGDAAEARSRLRAAMETAVDRRLVSDVPLGAFLSGGVDSTLIVGLMSRLASEPPSTFTLVLDGHESEDVSYARRVADRFGTDHQEVRVSENDLLEQVTDGLGSQDHPTGDGLNTYLVSRAAREAGLTVALSGVGGDELFGGYATTFRRLQRARRWRALWKLAPASLRSIIGAAAYAVHPSVTTAVFRDVVESDGSLAEVYPVLRRVFFSPQIKGLLTGVPRSPHLASEQAASVLERRAVRSALEGATLAEMSVYMRDVLLRDADQMGMASSLEIRVPFLDTDVVSAALALGDRARRPTVPPKRFLTDVFDDLVPEEVARRRKEGFTLPMKRWMRGELREFCREAIDHLAAHAAFAGDEVRAVWQGFLDGDSRYTWSRPWLLVALGAWVDRHSLS